jgi:hypothetical protein
MVGQLGYAGVDFGFQSRCGIRRAPSRTISSIREPLGVVPLSLNTP